MEEFTNTIKTIIGQLKIFSDEVETKLQYWENNRYIGFDTYLFDLNDSIEYALHIHGFIRGHTDIKLCRMLESAYLYNYEYIQYLNVDENKKVSLKNAYQAATRRPGRDIEQLIRLICSRLRTRPLTQNYNPQMQEFTYT